MENEKCNSRLNFLRHFSWFQYFTISISFLTCWGCRQHQPKFSEFQGIKYLHIHKPESGLIYVDNIEQYDSETIAHFCYCLSQELNINDITITSEVYYITAIWAQNERGFPYYHFHSILVDKSINNREVVLEKQIASLTKSIDGNSYDTISGLPKKYECKYYK